MTSWLMFIAGAYLVGSIPFGVLIGKSGGIDIRQHGSRNVGATNVTRVLGKPLGTLCFLLDMGKGAGPVILAGVYTGIIGLPVIALNQGDAAITQGEIGLWLAVMAAAIIGHMYSVFLGFGGGKGVATGFGGMLAMWSLLTIPALMALVVWYVVLRLTKYVGLASVVGAASLPIWCMVFFVPPQVETAPFTDSLQEFLLPWPLYAVTTSIALLVLWKHRGNLARIKRGEEPKIGGLARRGDLLANTPAIPPTNETGPSELESPGDKADS